ncbi:MAG: hypothetical protein OQK98_08490 [Gammaproteobacteria bacterium]|nr:hypothetical protein [Gammaproteobacteria bacterium]
MDKKITCFYLLSALLLQSGFISAGVKLSVDPQTQLKGWKLNQAELELELIQRLPDQTRGFFLARGFSSAVADDIANACVFQTIVRNKGSEVQGRPISISLKSWRIEHEGKLQPLKLKEDWNRQWSDLDVKPSAQLAFRWATFPTEQTFYPVGDYNWGMISFGLAPGKVFDLNLQWKIDNQTYRATIKNIQCTQDN